MHTISPTATEKNWKCFFWCVCVWVWKRKRDRECQMWVCACLCHEMYLKLRSYSNANQESKADRDWSTRTGPCTAPRSTQDLRPHISISAHPSQQEKERLQVWAEIRDPCRAPGSKEPPGSGAQEFPPPATRDHQRSASKTTLEYPAMLRSRICVAWDTFTLVMTQENGAMMSAWIGLWPGINQGQMFCQITAPLQVKKNFDGPYIGGASPNLRKAYSKVELFK